MNDPVNDEKITIIYHCLLCGRRVTSTAIVSAVFPIHKCPELVSGTDRRCAGPLVPVIVNIGGRSFYEH